MIRTAAVLTLLVALPAQALPAVPKLDIESTCRRAGSNAGSQQSGYKNCLTAERAAQQELAKKWPTFKSGPQAVCTTSTTVGGAPSYVELITCLELDKQAGEAAIENRKSLVLPGTRSGRGKIGQSK